MNTPDVGAGRLERRVRRGGYSVYRLRGLTVNLDSDNYLFWIYIQKRSPKQK